MVTRKSRLLGVTLSVFGAVSGMFFGLGQSPGIPRLPLQAPVVDGKNPPKVPEKTVGITATLDRVQVSPGEKVHLTEVISQTKMVTVHSPSHRVYLIGEYNTTHNCIIPLDPQNYRFRLAKKDFKDLPQNVQALNPLGWPFNIYTPRTQGYEFEFTPLHLGLFQITAEWGVETHVLESQPVILMVLPPETENGKAKVKPEWLIKDE